MRPAADREGSGPSGAKVRGSAPAGGPGVAMWAGITTSWGLRLGLASVFLYAGMTKLGDPGTFATQIEGFQIIRGLPANLAAVFLPWLEIVAGVGLLIGPLVRGAAAILACLLCVFLAPLLAAYWRGLDVACGCFGGDPAAEGDLRWAAGRNLVLLAMTLATWWFHETRRARSVPSEP